MDLGRDRRSNVQSVGARVMDLRPLGNTGIRVPPLVFGATSLGNLFRLVPEEEKSRIVAAWVDADWRPIAIDSAGKYGAGMSLEVIGRELERLNVPPGDVLISNKLGWRRVPLTGDKQSFEPDAWFGLQHDAVQDISYDGILRCWEEGNRLLGRYTADLVSVHDPDDYLAAASDASQRRRRMQDILESYRALVDLRDSGQVRAVGIGAKNWQTIRELAESCRFDWVMFANSFTIYHHPAALNRFMRELAAQGCGIFNSALFHGGFLLGGNLFDYRPVRPDDAEDRQRIEWRQRFESCCRDVGYAPFEIGVAFGAAHPAVTAVALSSSRADRIGTHVAAVQQRVPDEVWREFRHRGLITDDCDFLP